MALPNRLTTQEKARFFYQFAALLNAGLTLPQSLNLAGKDFNPAFQRYLQRVGAAVEAGQEMALALAFNHRYFDGWTMSLIRLAEYSGSLAQTSRQLAVAAEAQVKRERLYRSVNFSAIAIIWGLLIMIAVIFNSTPMGFIKPEFWLRSFTIALLLLGISFMVSRYSSRRWQELLMNLPVVGALIKARSLLYLAQLQLPLSCGVPILTVLELARDHIPDPVMKANLSSSTRKIRAGQTLSYSLQGKLPPIAIQMIRTGEETGNLDSALYNVGEHYRDELEQGLRQLERQLRPISILVIGGLIAVVGIRGMILLLNLLPD
ncbi:MAG TPA: type II secretion system F family protein [Cyanophyceae cyanobacterium]